VQVNFDVPMRDHMTSRRPLVRRQPPSEAQRQVCFGIMFSRTVHLPLRLLLSLSPHRRVPLGAL
jgi:hypothetical protein